MVVTLTLGGVKVTALLDTGANCSVLRYGKFRQYAKATHRPVLLKKSSVIKTISGQRIEPVGRACVKVDGIASPREVILVQDDE